MCNKTTTFCLWRNKATTVFKDFGWCVTRELLSEEYQNTCFATEMTKTRNVMRKTLAEKPYGCYNGFSSHNVI